MSEKFTDADFPSHDPLRCGEDQNPNIMDNKTRRFYIELSEVTNEEIVEKSKEIVSEISRDGTWRMTIPVNKWDSDIIICELIRRFEEFSIIENELNKWAEGWEDTALAIETEQRGSKYAHAIATVIRNFRTQFRIESPSK